MHSCPPDHDTSPTITDCTLGAIPELRQINSLTLPDFERHPVWLQCHIVDYNEPWYDRTDEETFRPWDGSLPVGPTATYLVRADFRLSNGAAHAGYVTPAAEVGNIGALQPTIVLDSGERLPFWYGMFRPSLQRREAIYRALATEPHTTFPIAFTANQGLAQGITSEILLGFYSVTRLGQLPQIDQ